MSISNTQQRVKAEKYNASHDRTFSRRSSKLPDGKYVWREGKLVPKNEFNVMFIPAPPAGIDEYTQFIDKVQLQMLGARG
jgi:hypothetical protein